MSSQGSVSWGGYVFEVYHASQTNWNNVPGVYIFAGLSADAQWWHAKYVGQTKSFASRLANHERWYEAEQVGATHIHARVVQNPFERTTIETVLIQTLGPPLNQG